MSRYTDFINARLDENTHNLPAPVTAALRSLAAIHSGTTGDTCDGCGLNGWEEGVPAEQCEQAHEIAAIWADHPDYPGEPTLRARLLDADSNGQLTTVGSGPLVAAGFARSTPAGVYLTPQGRELLPTGHPAAGRVSSFVFDWGRDPYPDPAPEVPTVAGIRRYPAYYICGPGRDADEDE